MKTATTNPKKIHSNLHINGFSLVEMLVVAPIVILMIGIFITTIISMTGDALSNRASNVAVYEIQDALSKIDQDIKISGGVLATNNIVLSSPQGYDDKIQNFDNASTANGSMLVLNMYATTNNPYNSDRNIMYLSNRPNACNSANLNQNQAMTYNVVYFTKDESLWRRTLMPMGYDSMGCANGSVSSPWQQPSCKPTITGGLCATQDEKLINNIKASDFVVNYYPSIESTTDNIVASDPSASDIDRQNALKINGTVGINVTTSGTVAGRDIGQSGSIRSTSTNDNILSYSGIVNNGLYVNLDAANADSYRGSGNSWKDLSGNQKDGTLVNGVGYSSDKDGLLTFNGTNQYVSDYSIPDSLWNAGSWTVSTWIKFDTVSKGFDNAILGHGSESNNNGLHLCERNGSAYFGLYGNDIVSNAKLSAGAWYNIVFSFDYTTKQKRIFVNGVIDSTGGTVGYNGTNSNTEIGRFHWATGSLMDGSISNMQIYNRTLTNLEVQHNFNNTKSRYDL
jgi:type II secretory pathway pseudopilin PulG